LRKAILLTALLAMMLATAVSAAFAQTETGGSLGVLQHSCDQIQAAVNLQAQSGEGTGAIAGATQSLGIDQQQVLACFGTAVALQDSRTNVGRTVTASPDATTVGLGQTWRRCCKR
jgi:hypothetical protein